MNLTGYTADPGDGEERFLERLNPLSKLFAITPVMAFLLVVADPFTPLLFVGSSAVITVALGRLSSRQYLTLTAPIVALAAGFALIYPVAAAGSVVDQSPVLARLGPLTLRRAGVEFGATIAVRVLSVTVLSLLFVTTTDAESFLRATVQNLGVPYRVGYTAMAAFRFIPMLRSDLRTIRAAHRIRGRGGGGGIVGRLRRVGQYSIPLFVNAIRRAERTALAMDARAFGACNGRTHYREVGFARVDWLFVGSFWLSSALLAAAADHLGVLTLSVG